MRRHAAERRRQKAKLRFLMGGIVWYFCITLSALYGGNRDSDGEIINGVKS